MSAVGTSGCVGRFAAPAHTHRLRDIPARNGLCNSSTPRAVLKGKDGTNWSGQPNASEPARPGNVLKQLGTDKFEASVILLPPQ